MMRFQEIVSMTTASLCLYLSACTPLNQTPVNAPEIEAGDQTMNIVGGRPVGEGSRLSRSVVFLVNRVTGESCTATLIGDNFALTAAHCVDTESLGNMYVFFAAQPNRETQRRQVINAQVSPYWETNQNENKNTSDIAVIKFEGKVLPNGYQAAQILPDDSLLKKGTHTLVLGYGISDSHKKTGAGALRYTLLPIADRYFSPTEILLDQSRGTSVCHGDSGGPAFVFVKNSNGSRQYYLWGVANHGSKDDTANLCNKSVVYTNATLFATWIELTKKRL